MTTQQLDSLDCSSAVAIRDALVCELITDGVEDAFHPTAKGFVNALCDMQEGWLLAWRDGEELLAGTRYAARWSDLRQLIECVGTLRRQGI